MKGNIRAYTVVSVFLFFFLIVAAPSFAAGEQPSKDNNPQKQSQSEGMNKDKNLQKESQSKGMNAEGQNKSAGQVGSDGQAVLTTYRAGELIGKTLKNTQGQDLGEITDIVSGPNGRVQYLIVSHGGVFGIGSNLTPVPWNAVNLQIKNGEALTNLSQEKFLNAPHFRGGDWPNFAQDSYDQKVQSYYSQGGTGQQPQAGAASSGETGKKGSSASQSGSKGSGAQGEGAGSGKSDSTPQQK